MQRTRLLVVLAVFALTLTSLGQKIYRSGESMSTTQYIQYAY